MRLWRTPAPRAFSKPDAFYVIIDTLTPFPAKRTSIQGDIGTVIDDTGQPRFLPPIIYL